MKPETLSALAAGGRYMPAVEDDPATAPLAVHPRGGARMLGVGLSKFYDLLREGELTSYHVGRSRFITVASIREYIARRLAAAA